MNVNNCVQCGACRGKCIFLDRYGLTIGNLESLKELAYHCFLCGQCTEVCPVGIDGRKVMLQLRRDAVKDRQGKPGETGYVMLLLEKKKYLFRNYKGALGKSVLFPGCNFPSFYPKTTRYLEQLLKPYGIGVVYDCCGKPVAELGMDEDADRILARIGQQLRKQGIEEFIMVCPNCYHYLKGKLPVKLVSIYEKLQELGLCEKEKTLRKGNRVFLPCPDRYEKELFAQIQGLFDQELIPITGAQCCGLGGCAAGKEPELVKCFSNEVKKEIGTDSLGVYCASCAGAWARQGISDVHHLLCDLLGVEEQPDIRHSLWNRMKRKF